MSLVTYKVDERQLNKFVDIFGDIRDVLASVVEQATADAAPSALQAAQAYPRPAVHPFVWSLNPQKNARARAYYFAAIKRGEINTNGSRYIRTGKFGKSFDVGVQESGDSVDAVFGSDFDKASLIVGDADGSIKQIPGHERTNWYEFRTPADTFTDDVITNVSRELPNAIEKRVN